MVTSESSTDSFNRYAAKQRERFHAYQSGRRKGIVKKLAGIIVVVTVIGGGWLLFSQKPTGATPGQTIPDLGRDHVPEGEIVEYNSNPPTSGSHYESWEKPGIYDRPLKDEKLVHSLEHGYIIVSYNCSRNSKLETFSSLRPRNRGTTRGTGHREWRNNRRRTDRASIY